MNYHYYQKDGGNEPWKPVREDKLDTIDGAMFLTILSVSSQPSDGASRDELAAIKYKGPFYVDLDDASSPASTAVFAKELISKLEDKDVFPAQLEIYASGGKGFHVIVPEECFLNKPPKGGMTFLPSIYKEMAFELAVESMDFRVYTARKGRMFRLPNVQRPNGLYKVRISYDELCLIAELSETAGKEAAEAEYKRLCSQPRRNLDVPQDSPNEASGLMALFDACKAKVSKGAQKARKRKPVDLPQELPSFEALLRGEGLKDGLGFHQIAMQVAITAHAKSMTCEDLLAAADGLCQNHESDGYRYNTPAKRRAELTRMWEYTDDNPCYEYSSHAITGLLNHTAADLHGIALTPEEVEESIAEGLAENTDEYGHANIIMTKDGAFALTEAGNKKITAVSFENATELVSAETNQVSVMEADVLVGGVKKGRHTFELDTFNSVSNLNKVVMRFGQSFSGNDTHARGMYMRLVEKARKGGRRMYVINREGLDYVSIPFHEDERLRKGFMVWSDSLGVSVEPSVEDSGIKMRFVGYPDPLGQFQTDLSDAPNLAAWIKEGENKYQLGAMLKNLLHCQNPAFIGKLLGWSVACHYRMLFHALHGQFPMLHINGPAGMGKTQMALLFSNLHYYKSEPKMLSPSSTLFAVGYSASASSSIPLVLDEFKPSEMPPHVYDRFKLMLRDAYNCRAVERGGGTRDNADYRSVHKTQLSAPICFIAEAAESESALMERVVLLTLVKPDAVKSSEYFVKFTNAKAHRELLGMIGKYISAQVIKRYGVAQLAEEFNPIYAAERKALMLQPGETDLSPEEYRRKSGAKERTVYNYSVVKFGITKFRNLIESIYGDEFKEVFELMLASACDSMDEIQSQTIPEWLKVMNTFADMARISDLAPYYLQEGKDYAYVQHAGKACFELYASSAYFKYRAYCGAARIKPLYPSQAAFGHALNHIPALVLKGDSVELQVPGGSHVFDLAELRAAGFILPETRK